MPKIEGESLCSKDAQTIKGCRFSAEWDLEIKGSVSNAIKQAKIYTLSLRTVNIPDADRITLVHQSTLNQLDRISLKF